MVERQCSLHGRTDRKIWRPMTVRRAHKNIGVGERHVVTSEVDAASKGFGV